MHVEGFSFVVGWFVGVVTLPILLLAIVAWGGYTLRKAERTIERARQVGAA